MRKTRPDVPDAELAVLKDLWDRGPATIREITDKRYPGGEIAHYATAQKLLERLRLELQREHLDVQLGIHHRGRARHGGVRVCSCRRQRRTNGAVTAYCLSA